MRAQVKEYLGLPEAGGGKEGPSFRDSRWSMALIIYFQNGFEADNKGYVYNEPLLKG